jgi:hypothetical protein
MNIGEVGQMLTGIAALMAAVNSMRNTRKIEHVTQKVDAVGKATDGIVAQLVQTTKTEAFAAGQKDQKENGS